MFDKLKARFTPQATKPDGLAVLEDPILFSEWLLASLICLPSFEDDLRQAPSLDQCARLKISDCERIQCANENALLRGLASLLFIQQQGRPEYTKVFGRHLIPAVETRMRNHAPSGKDPKTREGFAQYLDDFASENPATPVCLTYLARVYPECPSADSMFPKIPLELGFYYVMKHLEATQKAAELLGTGRLLISDDFFKTKK